jgi:hypothetical protein
VYRSRLSVLHTNGRISGTVIMADGKPARYAQVQIVRVSADEQNLHCSYTMRTDISK